MDEGRGRIYASVQMQLSRHLDADLLSNNPREMDATGESNPLAVCRAFLKTNGVEEIEVPDKEVK